MKVLFVFPNFFKRARRLQYDFIIQLNKLCDFSVYGKGLSDSRFNSIPFKKNRPIKEVIDYYKPDVILFHMWDMYHGKGGKGGNMPDGIEDIKDIPKVMFEVDYWSLPDYNWYHEIGFDLIIQRGWFPYKEIPSVWLPFSATEEFYPTDNKKENKIFFVGGINKKNPLYNTRKKAINILSDNGLLFNKGRVDWKGYPDFIRKFTCGLSCGCSEWMCNVGKTYEYMASGIATLCSPMHGQEVLFDGKECIFEYAIDCHDIIEVAKSALNDVKRREYIVNNAIEVTHKQHMDKHRIVELHDILKAIVEGKPIPRKWGH